jgi:zinc transport system substrate-binding protein
VRSQALACLAALAALAGCGERQRPGDLVIAASFYPVYIEALNVAGGVPGVRVVDLTRPTTGCLHDYQLTTEDLRTLAAAEIFIVNGGGMESFLDKAVKQLPRLQVVDASKGIEFLENGDGSGANPHVWVSIAGAQRQVRNIAQQLSALDPSHAPQYRQNAADYLAKLDALRAGMHEALKGAAGRRIVTMHEAFPYFAAEFKLQVAAVIEREPGSAPSAGQLAAIIDLVKRSGITALFAEPQYPAGATEAIARETGAKLYTLDPAVTGPDEKDAYLVIMRRNLDTLKLALRGRVKE